MVILPKSILRPLILLLFIVICTGCANVDYSVTINKDDSANIEYILQFDNSQINIADYSKITNSITEELEEKGFVVETSEKQIKAVKCIENILDLSDWDSLIKSNNGTIFTVDNKFFFRKYNLDAKIDFTGYSTTVKELNLDKELNNLIKIKFAIKLPAKYTSTNADIMVEEDLLVWGLEYGEVNNIQASYRMISVGAISATIGVVVAAILIFILRKFYFRKGKH